MNKKPLPRNAGILAKHNFGEHGAGTMERVGAVAGKPGPPTHTKYESFGRS